MSDQEIPIVEAETQKESQVTWEYLQSLGFRDGQRLSHEQILYKNEGLYNRDGTKVGWGDLSHEQIAGLIEVLPEPIFLLNEHASHWNHVSFMDFPDTPRGDATAVVTNTRVEQQPGIDYVVKNTQAVIWPKSKISGHEPGLYRFLTPNGDSSFGHIPSEEVDGGVKKYTEKNLTTFAVLSGERMRVIGEMVPEVKSKVDKKLWKRMFPNRTFKEKLKDKFSR